jgi:ABC-2 type transport system permease protein
MNAAVTIRLLRDGRLTLILLTMGVMLCEVLFMTVLGEFGRQGQMQWMQQEFVQRIMRTFLGAELTPDMSPTGLMCLGFSHPLIYALAWSFILSSGTRMPAGEIDRGTADLLLTLPLTRTALFLSVSAQLLLGVVMLSTATIFGLWIGEQVVPLWEPLDFSRFGMIVVNLLALHLCVSGGTLLASSFQSRRGPAVAIVLGCLLASFLLELLGQFSATARAVGVISPLHYYRPLALVRGDAWPWTNLLVLASAAMVFWTVALVQFRRRDIPAA